MFNFKGRTRIENVLQMDFHKHTTVGGTDDYLIRHFNL